jgi:hypothetical protein
MLKTDMYGHKVCFFTDESRATLDCPDGWSKGWDEECPKKRKFQHGGGGL